MTGMVYEGHSENNFFHQDHLPLSFLLANAAKMVCVPIYTDIY